MIIAIVNGYKIHQKEYARELQCVLKKSRLHEPNHEAKLRAIEQLIDGYLLLEQAKKENLTISQEELDNKIIEIMLQYKTETEFKEMLFSKNLNIETLRNKIANDLLMEKFYQTHFPISDDIPMSKLKEVYNENVDSFQTMELVRAAHILIKGDDDTAYQKILKIREEITSGDDFFRFAEQFSECPSHCQCGDLGYVKKGTLMKEFEDIIFHLDLNQVSKPIKTEFGYHLIMVTEKKAQKTADFEEVKHALKKRVQQIDCELKLIRYLKKLRTKAKIEIYEENL